MSDQPAEDLYELRTTSTVRRALGEVLPEAVAAAAYEFITGSLLQEPYRVGKRVLPPVDDRFSARRRYVPDHLPDRRQEPDRDSGGR